MIVFYDCNDFYFEKENFSFYWPQAKQDEEVKSHISIMPEL